MPTLRNISFALAILAGVSGCASVEGPAQVVSSGSPISAPERAAAASTPLVPTLKRKVAVGRFSNSTQYGKALLLDATQDPIADQASDILMSDLVRSNKFLVLERPDIDVVEAEHRLTGTSSDINLVGVDALIVGSVTELGRMTEGKVGFLSSTKKQVVTAKVEIRLVDSKTGVAFFSGTGSGSASTESGEVAGFGSRAGYDGTLRDKAIGAAISDLMSDIVMHLNERRWSTDILEIRGSNVLISGGQTQGLKVGDRLVVETLGRTARSKQTGFDITLPGDAIAEVEIISFFGDDDFSQGSVARLVSGRLPSSSQIGNMKVVLK